MNKLIGRARILRRATARHPALLLLGVAVSGCAGLGQPTVAQGPATQTVMGDYEIIATCVAAAGENSAGGAPTLRVDRARKVATVRRVLGASNELQYEVVFTQTGAATVHVEGRGGAATQDSGRGLGFLWPQVGLCATSVMAP